MRTQTKIGLSLYVCSRKSLILENLREAARYMSVCGCLSSPPIDTGYLFDAELYTMTERLEGVVGGKGATRRGVPQEATLSCTKIHIGTDFHAAIAHLQYTMPGHGQWLNLSVIARAQRMTNRGVEVEVHLVSFRLGDEGNEQAHRTSKVSAKGMSSRRCTE